jgi:osmoprotectant transport system ATP-binding protein
MPGADAIVLENVTVRFGALTALDRVTLAVLRGQTTVLIGPSGCGKSTLLKTIIRLVEPDEGTVQIDGAVMDERAVRYLRRRLGYVIQDGGLFPHLTARGNVTLMASYLGVAEADQTVRLEILTKLTHFPADAMDRFPAELSGGQRQRVSLMRALMLDPEILLMDEPLGSLDPMIRFDMQNELKEIFRALEKTVVLVTHDMAEAMHFGDVVVLMNEGRIEQVGPGDALLAHPGTDFAARFVRSQRRDFAAEETRV